MSGLFVSVKNAIAQAVTDLKEFYAASTGALNIGFMQVGVGAVIRWVQNKLRESKSIADYGALQDGITDDAAAFNAAIVAQAAIGGGTVTVPNSLTKTVIASVVTMLPGVSIKGAGWFAPTIQFTGGVGTLFNFLGTSEAQALSVEIKNLVLESATPLSGVAVRARNFYAISLKKVDIVGFDKGVWTDWGLRLYIDKCDIVLNNSGVVCGGGVGGLRNAPPPYDTSAFMDTVDIKRSVFSQNQIDINDMGSERSLGGLAIKGCSFFESTAVAGKVQMIRIASRRGFSIENNWFEDFVDRKQIVISNYDNNGVLREIPSGGRIDGNVFRVQGGAGARGVFVERSNALTIENNAFWWGNAAGGYGIDLQDTTSPVSIGINNYDTYDGGSYTANVLQAKDFNLFLGPDTTQRALATPGFVIHPGGVYEQWGVVDFTATGKPIWIFPVAFPTACIFASCTVIWDDPNGHASLVAAPSNTTAQFRLSIGVGTAVTGMVRAIGY